MKDFIKYKFRTLLEGARASHTPNNPVGRDKDRATNSDLQRTMHKIVSLNNQYGQEPYFQDTHAGDGIYLVTILSNGSLTVKTPNTMRKLTDSDIGLLKTGTHGNKHVYVRAYRGIEHPDINQPKTGEAKTSSPANDAAIKTYLVFGKDILEFVKQNIAGEDDYTSDDNDFTDKTSDEWKYKYDKLEKEKQRKLNKSTITMDPDKAAEYEKRQADLIAKYERIKNRRK
jgi:hypothetical protein